MHPTLSLNENLAMPPVPLGLIGLGHWPRETYLPLLLERPDVEVVAVAARSEKTRAFARQHFGPRTTLYADYADLLADPHLSAVMIALPNPQHHAVTLAAIQAQKHVWIEPPLGLREAEIEAVLAAAETSSHVFQADLELRCLPVLEEMRGRLAAGDFGSPLSARVKLWCDWGYGGGKWQQDPASEGFFLWLGTWYLDVLDALFAAEPTQVAVSGGRAMNGSLMDHGTALLSFPGGMTGQFHYSLVAVTGLQITAHLTGTEGEMEANLKTGESRLRRADHAEWVTGLAPASQPVYGFEGMRESLAAFLSAVAEGKPVPANVAAARRVHRAAWKCHQADQSSLNQAIV
jgi:myo-inositol 2-dehydrogenase/D-chiro-inositol 1-dehydrogenase